MRDLKKNKDVLNILNEMEKLYTCLSSYFSNEIQVLLSIALGCSDGLKEGLWNTVFTDFAEFMKTNPNYIDIIGLTQFRSPKQEDSKTYSYGPAINFLKYNLAQTDFYLIKPTNITYVKTTNIFFVNSHLTWMMSCIYQEIYTIERYEQKEEERRIREKKRKNTTTLKNNNNHKTNNNHKNKTSRTTNNTRV